MMSSERGLHDLFMTHMTTRLEETILQEGANHNNNNNRVTAPSGRLRSLLLLERQFLLLTETTMLAFYLSVPELVFHPCSR